MWMTFGPKRKLISNAIMAASADLKVIY